MSLYFPKLNQLRFRKGSYYSITEPNIDNTDPSYKYMSGVYPQRFYQPILSTWPAPVGDGNELDFCIHSSSATWATEKLDCVVHKIIEFDKYGDYSLLGKLGANATDWFLPSKDELIQMYTMLHLKGIGNFASADYWSSSETNVSGTYYGVIINFGTGVDNYESKGNSNSIRPVRRFAGSLGDYDFGDQGPAGGWVFTFDGTYFYEAYWSDIMPTVWSNVSGMLGSTSNAIGEGINNTAEIIAQGGHTTSAALSADSHSSTGATSTIVAEKLTPADFYTYSSGRHVYRFTKSLSGMTGHYVVRITGGATHANPGAVFYESNVFEVAASFDDCYAFVASNFENDFGVCWINTSGPTTWYLKMMLPSRMYVPKVKIKKDVYATDSGAMSTLRSVMNRGYEVESMPIPMWYAELIQLMTACSTMYLNDLQINFEETPAITPVQDSDLCVLKGDAVLVGFNDYYLLNL